MDANSELADAMLAEYRAFEEYYRFRNEPAAKIAKSLKRTLGATRKKASELGVSLDSRGVD
jgi:hypothetical protein